jgi:hypothetical protein
MTSKVMNHVGPPALALTGLGLPALAALELWQCEGCMDLILRETLDVLGNAHPSQPRDHGRLVLIKAWQLNPCLSGIVWVVKLLILNSCVTMSEEGDGDTLQLIEDYCGRFLKQDTETPMGEILGWWYGELLMLVTVRNGP